MSVINKQGKTAIILFNLGGPDKPESVKPFLFNLFNDPAIIGAPTPIRWLLAKFISSKRAPVAKEIYAEIGNKSPIVENTREQAEALKAALSETGNVEVFISMRYWHPMSRDVVFDVIDYKPDHIILLPLYPQFSTTTTGSSLKDWKKTVQNASKYLCTYPKPSSAGTLLDVPTTTLCCYPTQKDFIHSQAALIKKAYDQMTGKDVRVLFSAHGLPEKIITAGDPYQKQVEATTEAVVAELAIDGLDYVNCYQSRVGPLKWIGPSTEEEIERAGKDNKAILLVPIAFVSEHSETLVELDIEYKKLAEEKGVTTYVRVPTVSADEYFIKGLAAMCLSVDQEGFYCPWEDGLQCVQDEAVMGTPIDLHDFTNKEQAA